MYACSLEIICAGYYKLLITSLTAAEMSSRCTNATAICGPRSQGQHFDLGINGLSVSVKTRKEGVCLEVYTELSYSHLSKVS